MCSFKDCVIAWCVRVYSFNCVVICMYIQIVLVSCVVLMVLILSGSRMVLSMSCSWVNE